MTIWMKRKYSIGKQMAWLTLAPLLIMAVSLETYFLHDRFASMDSNLLARGQLIAHQFAASSEYGVFADNRMFLDALTRSVMHERDMKAAMVLDAQSQVLAASGAIKGRPMDIAGAAKRATLSPSTGSSFKLVNGKTPILDRGSELLLYKPIMSTPITLDATAAQRPRQVGAVVIALTKMRLHRRKQHLLWVTVLATGTLLLAAWYLVYLASRRIVHPISQLSSAIQAIGAGHLETRVETSSRIAELRTLTKGVNRMAAELQHERSSLQHRIDEATEQLRNLAFYDTLTGLPNRRLLEDRLKQAMVSCRRTGHYGALMFHDLDNFKSLNDRFGHAMGDSLLVEAAHRISGCLREMDTVARFGGDEFVVMLSELEPDSEASRKQARIVAGKIGVLLEKPFVLGDSHEHRVEYQCS